MLISHKTSAYISSFTFNLLKRCTPTACHSLKKNMAWGYWVAPLAGTPLHSVENDTTPIFSALLGFICTTGILLQQACTQPRWDLWNARSEGFHQFVPLSIKVGFAGCTSSHKRLRDVVCLFRALFYTFIKFSIFPLSYNANSAVSQSFISLTLYGCL